MLSDVLEKLNPGKLILTHIGDDFEESLESIFGIIARTSKISHYSCI